MNQLNSRVAAALLGAALVLVGAGTARAKLEVKPPEGWTRIEGGGGDLAFAPPGGSPFRDAAIFDAELILSRNIEALEPLARAVFPEGATAGKLQGRVFPLDGYAAAEIWGGATQGKAHLVQATVFVWKGTRMIPVAVLANGDDPGPVRELAARIARGASVSKTETFFPVPDVPAGIVAPANWVPEILDEEGFTARASAPDDPAGGAPGMIRYEYRPGGFDQALDRLLEGLDQVARSRGAERVRTSGVDTRAAGRSVTAYQQAVDDRVVVTGAVIHYPAGALQVTYFDRPDRARDRKAMFDQLIDTLAASDIKPPAHATDPGSKGGGAPGGAGTEKAGEVGAARPPAPSPAEPPPP